MDPRFFATIYWIISLATLLATCTKKASELNYVLNRNWMIIFQFLLMGTALVCMIIFDTSVAQHRELLAIGEEFFAIEDPLFLQWFVPPLLIACLAALAGSAGEKPECLKFGHGFLGFVWGYVSAWWFQFLS